VDPDTGSETFRAVGDEIIKRAGHESRRPIRHASATTVNDIQEKVPNGTASNFSEIR
jgi:hypothetical protein